MQILHLLSELPLRRTTRRKTRKSRQRQHVLEDNDLRIMHHGRTKGAKSPESQKMEPPNNPLGF